MRQYPTSRIVWGTYKRECDRCGFDFLRSELVKDDYGLMVCSQCLDRDKAQGELPRSSTAERPFRRD